MCIDAQPEQVTPVAKAIHDMPSAVLNLIVRQAVEYMHICRRLLTNAAILV